MSNILTKTTTIVVGASQSDAIKMNQYMLTGITTGSYLTSTSLTFLGSDDGVTYYPLYNSSGEVLYTLSGSPMALSVDPLTFFGWNYLKLRRGNNGSPINQVIADAPINLILKEI
jgi:hypothetical protein